MKRESLGKIDNFIDGIDCSGDAKGVSQALSEHTRSMGFEYFALQAFGMPRGISRCLTSYPKEWGSRYEQMNYISSDMATYHASRSLTPFAWSEIGKIDDFTEEQRRVFLEAKEFGIISGASVPVHGLCGIDAQLAVASNLPDAELNKLFIARRHELQIIATYAYERLFEIGWVYNAFPNANTLTPRETEVLTWTAKGKDPWEISRILDTSDNTVRNHLKNITQKLSVQNKTQAVAIAVEKKLIAIH